jgi:hypothetical protein
MKGDTVFTCWSLRILLDVPELVNLFNDVVGCGGCVGAAR